MPTVNLDTFARDRLPARELWPDLLPAGLSYPDRLNAADVLLDHDGPCVHGDDVVWSYEELRERSGRIARVLVEEMGLVPGNRVLLHGPNTPELIAGWFGILRAGGVVVATMPLLRARELVKVIAKAQVTHALVDGPLVGEVEAARAQEPVLASVKRFDEVDGSDGAFESVATAAGDVALIAFTSGTTGEPKGCMHLHRELLATCDTFGRHILDPRPDEVFSGTPPLAFTFGLGGLVLFPLRFGASTAPCAKPGPDALLEAIGRHGITTLFTAPTGYRAMLAKAPADPGALASLRVCVSAGEPLPASVSDGWFERTGIRIIDGIGSTEMLHIFIASRPEDARAGSTGTAVPGYEARIVDDAMNELPPGEIGRLAVRGPTGCRYLDDPRQSTYVVDGWNLTGDAFRMDADGYFWFQARTDDMIVSSGYNISGAEVESALLEHPAVAECAVVASPDEERGHVVKAFVVVAPGAAAGDALVADLQAHVKARIAPYKYPRRVEFLDALPRTPTGKVQRTVLRTRDRSPS
ncbi:MAG: 2-aminobenzoate-CoA ligase [Solirubrobacteraceae bacterium]|jgi:2-aminobenzoate-CoA ligase|nr:2-aminobenzoate-CoA ligase [Solirubrobacteraceae bacterium]